MSKLTYEQTRLGFRVIDCLEDLQGYKQFMKEQKELKIGKRNGI